ncbi:MAG: hypothetical protein ACKV1O_06395 [Saprospiraceae bacterium]
MTNINSADELRATILHLEAQQDEEIRILKEQFHLAYESVKPINLIKSTFKQAVDSPEVTNNFLSTVAGLAAGYLSKKLFQSVSHSPIKKLLGTALQFGITTLIARNPEKVKEIGAGIFHLVSGLLEKDGSDDDEDE